MPIPVDNLDQVDAWSAGGILSANPDGTPAKYVVTIDDADDSGISSGGYPQIALEMSNDLGSSRDWIVVIPSTHGKVVQMWKAAGLAVPVGQGAMLNAALLKGRKVKITVAKEADNRGELRDRVVAYEPAGGAQPTTSDVTTARDLADSNFDGGQSQMSSGKADGLPF